MNTIIPIMLFGWIPVVLLLFRVLPPRRAALVAFLAAWMFLPENEYKFVGLPDYTKITATSLGVLLGVMLFDFGSVLALRLRLLDLPMILFCLCGMATSISNDLGYYDGLAEVLDAVVTWGVPYLIGRMYFRDRAAMKDLAVGVFIGGLIYLPLCVWEMRMGPTLHYYVYGQIQHKFAQAIRPGVLGDYRPMVFMKNGLMLSFWMASSTLAGFWLWRSGALRRLFGVPMIALTPLLLGVTLLCNSTGASLLLLGGLGVFGAVWVSRSRLALVCLLLVAPTYMVVRAADLWSGRQVVEIVEWYGLTRQAQSLEARMEQEDLFSDRAWQRPLLGWGGFDRMRPRDEEGNFLTRGMDSLWVITLGSKGLVGLTALTLFMLMPFAVWVARTPPRGWLDTAHAPSAAMGMILTLWMIDCMLNGMINPVFVLALGGLAGYRYSTVGCLESCPDLLGCSQGTVDLNPEAAPASGSRAPLGLGPSEWRPSVQPVFDRASTPDAA